MKKATDLRAHLMETKTIPEARAILASFLAQLPNESALSARLHITDVPLFQEDRSPEEAMLLPTEFQNEMLRLS